MIPSAVVISIVSYVGSISLALVFAKARSALGVVGRHVTPLGLVIAVTLIVGGPFPRPPCYPVTLARSALTQPNVCPSPSFLPRAGSEGNCQCKQGTCRIGPFLPCWQLFPRACGDWQFQSYGHESRHGCNVWRVGHRDRLPHGGSRPWAGGNLVLMRAVDCREGHCGVVS